MSLTGLLVKSIDRGQLLFKNSGIKENDIITQVDDTDIVSADQVLDIVEKAQIGDQVKLTVYSSETGAYFTAGPISSRIPSRATPPRTTPPLITHKIPMTFFEDYGNNKRSEGKFLRVREYRFYGRGRVSAPFWFAGLENGCGCKEGR